jgi:dihydroflavonol-4-reductase
VTNRVQLTPVAIREGQAFADTVFGDKPRTVDYGCIPSAVFSHPPIAGVGMTEAEARNKLGTVKIYTSDFRPMKNVLANRNERSLYKMIVDATTGRVVGLHMIGPDAPEILQAAAIAVKAGLTKEGFRRHRGALHPSMAEELVLLKSASEGTLRVLRVARDAGVRRFVQTSSAAAIAYGHRRGRQSFSEADWTNVDAPGVYPYIKSKTIAERAARDWMAAEGGDMEYCSINPTAILGPVLANDYSTSLELVKKLLEGAFPGTPNFGFGIVDVRDLADLHLLALTVPGLDGERFAASGRFMMLHEIAHVLKDRLGPEARKVPTRKLPDWLVRIVARFDPMVRQVVSELGNVRNIDASHAKAVFGWETRSEAESIEDTARSLIAHGLVKV